MKLRLPVLFTALFLYSACTVYREYPIEIYKPEEIVIPGEAKTAAIVYRNFRYTADTLQHFYMYDNQLVRAKHDPAHLDSLMAVRCLNELAIHLKNNEVFDELAVLPYNAFEKHSGDQLTALPAPIVTQLAADAVADMLISLESFSWFYSVWPADAEEHASCEVVTVSVWGVYDGVTGQPAEQKILIDTIYWNGNDEAGNVQYGRRIPSHTDALLLASAMAGESYASKFYAGWLTVNRMYSIPPLPDFSEAAYLFEEGKWDEAIEIWRRYADNRNGKMAINARYNLALACEMKDDLASAQEWLASAMNLAKSYRSKSDQKIIRTYQEVLDSRQRDLMKIEQPEK